MRALGAIIFAFVLFFAAVHTADAATIFLSPASGTYAVGDTIPVNVYVGTSPNEVMNAASVTITYPTDKIEATSYSKGGSIINLWANDPSFSNSSGKAVLEGVVLNPGYSGARGKLLTFYFKVKSIGQVTLVVSTATVLANDGQGTNILNGVSNATYTINPNVSAPNKNPPVETPAATTSATSTEATVTAPTLSATTTVVNNIEPQTPELPAPWSWGLPFVSYLSFGVVIFSLIFLLIFVMCAAILKFITLREKVRKDARAADMLTHKSFNVLKQEIHEHAGKLKAAKTKRDLTKEEEEFLAQFNEDLDEAERLVRDEIGKVGR